MGAATGKPALDGPLIGHCGVLILVAWSPDSSKIASGGHDGTVRVWDVVTGDPALGGPLPHKHVVSSVAWSPDGSKVASGSFDKTLRVWDAATGKLVLIMWVLHGDYVNSVAWSPCGSKIASGGNKNVRVWDAATGYPVLGGLLKGHSGDVQSVEFSFGGTKIVSQDRNCNMLLYGMPKQGSRFLAVINRNPQRKVNRCC